MKQKLIIPEVPNSLNKLFGMNHWVRAKEKERIHLMVYLLCKEQKLKPIKGFIKINFIVSFNDKRNRDYDNSLGGIKFIIDGLRYAGIIKDDNSKILREITMHFVEGLNKETIVEIQNI